MPFPSASQSSPGFKPNGYWQGAVWLDQAYFSISTMALTKKRDY